MPPKTPEVIARAEMSAVPIPAWPGDLELFRVLIERGSDVVALVEVETTRCVYVSPSVVDLLGWRAEALRGRRLEDLCGPRRAGRALSLAAPGFGPVALTAPSRMRRADGSWAWVSARPSEVFTYRGQPSMVLRLSAASRNGRIRSDLHAGWRRAERFLAPGGAHRRSARRHGPYEVAVQTLAAALELRDDETGHHARRVTQLAMALTGAVDRRLVRDPELRYGYLLHDIGKIGIPDSILLNPGRLDECDMRILRMHTILGEHLIATIPLLSGIARDVVACHHERWDGTGYPRGLAGEEIPLVARIFAVVDAFDAITSDRPYRPARSAAHARQELIAGAGTQFDPAIVRAFLALVQAGGEGLDPT